MDWYNSKLSKYTLESEWQKWEKIFCDIYAGKWWTPVKYGIEFKYIKGSLLDYTLKFFFITN